MLCFIRKIIILDFFYIGKMAFWFFAWGKNVLLLLITEYRCLKPSSGVKSEKYIHPIWVSSNLLRVESFYLCSKRKGYILRIDFRIFPTLNGIFLKAVWIFCNCGRALAKFVTHNKLAGGTNTTLKNCPFSDVLTFQVRFLFLIFMPSFSRAIYNYTTV